MAKKVTYRVKRRRRRDGKTNYRKRLYLLKSKKHRFIVRVSGRKIIAQVVRYQSKGDQTVVNTSSLELKKYGWDGATGNACSAYLTGLLCGKKALEKGVNEGILDIGLQTPIKGSNIFATLKGFVDTGIKIPHNKKALPLENRVFGEEIEKYRKIKLNVLNVKEKILKSEGSKEKIQKVKEHDKEAEKK